MDIKKYTMRTGALASSIIDAYKVTTKEIYVDNAYGKSQNIIEMINGDISLLGIKNGYNTKSGVTIDGVSYKIGSKEITKVENDAIYNGETKVADINSTEIKNGYCAFYQTTLASYDENLDSLTNGEQMFMFTNLTEWSGNMNNLRNGNSMFSDCTKLISFVGDMNKVTNASNMFNGCSKLASFIGDLSSLTDGNYMFNECSSLKTFIGDLSSLTNIDNVFNGCTSLTNFTADLSSLPDGQCQSLLNAFKGNNFPNIQHISGDMSKLVTGNHCMKDKTSLISFTVNLPSLWDASQMFSGCTNLTTFNSESGLTELISGDSMFWKCSKLTSFSGDLSKMTNGTNMFSGCTSLTSFGGNLSALITGTSMFWKCSKLTSFSGDLSEMTTANDMFSGCSSLKKVIGSFSKLINGNGMFKGCSGITFFNVNLSGLKQGDKMFDGCKLNAECVKNIVSNINDLSDDAAEDIWGYGKLVMGINVTNDSSTINSQLQQFAEDAGFTNWDALNAAFTNKGWTATWQYGGTSNSITLNELDGQTTSLPIWAKLEEVTNEEEYYEYVLEEDTTKHYIIDWFHETNGSTEGYQQFGSLLEAMGYFGVIPVGHE